MKKILTAIAFGAITATGAGALAQTPGTGYGPGVPQGVDPGFQQGQGYGSGMRGGRGNPAQRMQRRLQRMTQYLGLSAAQQTQIKAIMEEQQAKRTTLRTETHERISSVLSEQQQAVFEQMRAQRGKGRPGGWGPKGGGKGYSGMPGNSPAPAPGTQN